MEKWLGKTAVVTGASSGIGAAICVDLARQGVNVIGLARRVEKVEELSNTHKSLSGKIFARKCDISSVSDIKETFSWIESTFGGLEILVNNAAKLKYMNILSKDEDNTEDVIATINTNLTGVILCAQEAFKSMAKRDVYGYIVNINSVSGHLYTYDPEWRENVYPATKHGVTAATEVMRVELAAMKNLKIRISSVSPGFVKTNIFNAAGFGEDVDKVFEGWPVLEPEDVSDAVLYLLKTKSHVNIREITIQPTGERLN
ncbi:farnesol dehydrogenase-like [Culicoides brevitarsis]|uniref:farnesol dehydrogenase-like n=1 Tax=Culicoides brevitarsis TaxID=469753 RepID=UPI00307B18E5